MKKWIILVIVVAMAFGGLWFGYKQYEYMQIEKLNKFIRELDVETKLNIWIDHEYGEGYYGVSDTYDEGDSWIYYNVYDVDRNPNGQGVVSEYYLNCTAWDYCQG